MTDSNDTLVDAITGLTPALLTVLSAFEEIQRHMHPSRIDKLAEFIKPYEDELRAHYEHFIALSFPPELEKFSGQLQQSADYALRACNGFTGDSGDQFATMKAMRAQCRAQELIYPAASIMTPVSQFFLEPAQRTDHDLLTRLDAAAGALREPPVGLMNVGNDRSERGGFSLYVPEYLRPEDRPSLVVALHGGTGHGADFIWSWVREARTRGFIVLAPTSIQDTWSLMGEEYDLDPLIEKVAGIVDTWSVDAEHILLTGMSDGGTYSLLAGVRENSPFTHLAPFSGVLHPEIAMTGRMPQANGRNIYLVHGTLDWMFPIETAYMAKQELEAVGANLTFHAIDGLSHTYARFQNPDLIAWFNPSLAREQDSV